MPPLGPRLPGGGGGGAAGPGGGGGARPRRAKFGRRRPAAAMEPKHKELLAQCRQSLAEAMTEVDKVVELLEAAGALGPRDLRDLEAAGSGKAELLIALLLAKERDHFQDLRVALEKTQPHLLSILYLNGVAGAPAAAETAGEWGRGARTRCGPGKVRGRRRRRAAAALGGWVARGPPAEGRREAGRLRAGVVLSGGGGELAVFALGFSIRVLRSRSSSFLFWRARRDWSPRGAVDAMRCP